MSKVLLLAISCNNCIGSIILNTKFQKLTLIKASDLDSLSAIS